MNIRVDLNYHIKDGTEVVFRSPVDCSQVTGLKVYYPGASQEFVFADAHGNNVGDIDHLFAENVAVKVILDVINGMAFVQNADTNAYLEGRFDDIINKLCPTFTKEGTVVQCEPVEGYPLQVVTTLPGLEAGYTCITLTQCGKNLYNKDAYPLTGSYVHHGMGSLHASTTCCGTKDFIPVAHLAGQTVTLNHPPKEVGAGNPGTAFYDKDQVYITGYNDYTMTVPENAVYMRFSVPLAYIDGSQIQIELGGAVTEYEAYLKQVFTMEFPEPAYGGQYNWQSGILTDENRNETYLGKDTPVPALSGINTLYSNAGTTLVIGKADPVVAIEKLTQAVISLGGNI